MAAKQIFIGKGIQLWKVSAHHRLLHSSPVGWLSCPRLIHSSYRILYRKLVVQWAAERPRPITKNCAGYSCDYKGHRFVCIDTRHAIAVQVREIVCQTENQWNTGFYTGGAAKVNSIPYERYEYKQTLHASVPLYRAAHWGSLRTAVGLCWFR